ncbi:hypothetical protein BO83DRAFT_452949 [Aspergillus eucalypticola CBS 122712]|uniref:Uncharacterized protein n=1 Tax=Aspergillus eucalypticola (strain CBS 122712 / IBT 29274) TaxID=1448314 RepID=A0A317UV71_ASPEC|nr:uncharacterized protein BO83DRAFT_452949 [Aspergillus eucalypticola CBS 122712]PWY65904.1 hypothetical protein BO83DRAFT_452949 [Aspergillus eucalypticola CBS 122712]
MATTSTQKNPSKRSREEEMEQTPLNCQIPVPKPAIYPNEMYLCRRDEYHDMINHHKAIFYTLAAPRAAEVTVGHALESVFVRVRTWATMSGKGESLSHLADSDKQAIIASLDEYCTMLKQFICTKFIDSPFWFMDGKINATDSEPQSDFHKRFQYVYERLLQVSREDAAWWRSINVGKLNDEPCVMNNIPPTPVGRNTIKHRTALVKTYTDELMRSRLFQLLLRDPMTKYKRSQRKSSLRLLLESAAQTVIHGDGGLYGNMNIVRLPDLPKFNHWSGQTIVHPFHAGFEPVEGSRVLIVTRPSYSYIDIISLKHFCTVPPYMVNRAEVLDTVGMDKEEGDSQEDDDTEENADPVRDLPPLRETIWRQ